MVLSASQARLLSLTARQSNIEYEGQQINQQRTTLSNESSNYYNSLLEMSVPVPPSTNDYTKIVYTFTIGGNEATIKEALPLNDDIGNTTYYITYNTDFDENKVYYLATMNHLSDDEARELKRDGQTIYVACDTVSGAARIIGKSGYEISPKAYEDAVAADPSYAKECKFYREYISSVEDGTKTKYAISYAQIPNEATYNAHQGSASVKDLIYEYNDAGETAGFYSYQASNQSNFTVVDPQYAEAFINADLDINDYYQYESTSGIRFAKREDVEGNLNSQTRAVKTSAVSTITVTKQGTMSGATIEFDAQGRIANITDEEGITYTMTATTETDNVAYDDAYNQYEYNQYVYDQRQTEINANIKILQAQDKSLELRLSTLDTQHSAIQTELEAVKKVMSKNIENSFKTFNA